MRVTSAPIPFPQHAQLTYTAHQVVPFDDHELEGAQSAVELPSASAKVEPFDGEATPDAEADAEDEKYVEYSCYAFERHNVLRACFIAIVEHPVSDRVPADTRLSCSLAVC